MPVSDSGHIAAHELGHDAQAAVELLDEAVAARADGDDATVGALLDRLRRTLERFEQDIERLVANRGGDLNTLQRRPTNLANLVRTVVSAHPTGSHPIELECAEVLLNVDPVKVERIIDNLLTNALRYTPPECPVRIRLSAAPAGAELVVEDEGPGLPEHLCDAIARGDDDPAVFDGATGLWLILRFARLHNGGVTVSRTASGGGARFRVWIPAR